MAGVPMVQSDAQVVPHPDEVLGSLLARRAWRAAHSTASFAKSMGLPWDVWCRDIDRSVNVLFLNKVAEGLGIGRECARTMTVNTFLSKCGVPVQAIGFEPWITYVGLVRWKRIRYGQMYCCGCLDCPDRYLCRDWRIATNWLCPVHSLPLQDCCPECGKPFTPYRDDELVLARCGRCTTSLAGHDLQPVSDEELELHRHIQSIWNDARTGRPGPLCALYRHLSEVAVCDPRFALAGEHWSYWRTWERAALLRSQEGFIMRLASHPSRGALVWCGYNRARDLSAKPKRRSASMPIDPQRRAQLLLDLARRVRWPRRSRARVSQ